MDVDLLHVFLRVDLFEVHLALGVAVVVLAERVLLSAVLADHLGEDLGLAYDGGLGEGDQLFIGVVQLEDAEQLVVVVAHWDLGLVFELAHLGSVVFPLV